MKTGLIKVESNCKGLGSLHIVYQGSALNEQEGYRGVSHLAEHLICKSYEHLNDKLQSAGIVSNAYTSDDHISFFWNGLNRKIEEFQAELLNLTKYIPKKDDFEKEKLIVLQEYDDYVSGQDFVFSNIQRKYLNYFGPIGIRKDIEEIDYDSFIAFLVDQFMRPTSIIRIGESSTIDELTSNIQYMPLRKPTNSN
jgi:predicted Zn-dependent peptidase